MPRAPCARVFRSVPLQFSVRPFSIFQFRPVVQPHEPGAVRIELDFGYRSVAQGAENPCFAHGQAEIVAQHGAAEVAVPHDEHGFPPVFLQDFLEQGLCAVERLFHAFSSRRARVRIVAVSWPTPAYGFPSCFPNDLSINSFERMTLQCWSLAISSAVLHARLRVDADMAANRIFERRFAIAFACLTPCGVSS